MTLANDWTAWRNGSLATENNGKPADVAEEVDWPEPVNILKLIADNPTLHEPVVDGLFRRGETANIIAAPKVGKSWLAYMLAICVAAGACWLNRFRCQCGRVLLIDLELHQPTLAHRIPRVADALEIAVDDYAPNLEVLPLRGQPHDMNGIARILGQYEPGDFELIILDAQYRAMPKGASENDNAAMTELYNLIDATAARLDVAWVTIHHSSKGNQSSKSVTDVGSGAGSMSRAVDAHIVLREHEEAGCAVMEAALRSFAPLEPVPLRWEFPLWHVDEHLDAEQLKGRQTKQQEQRTKADQKGREAILAELTTPQEIRTQAELRRKTGISRDRIQRLLEQLEADGEIDFRQTVINGTTTNQYRRHDDFDQDWE